MPYVNANTDDIKQKKKTEVIFLFRERSFEEVSIDGLESFRNEKKSGQVCCVFC